MKLTSSTGLFLLSLFLSTFTPAKSQPPGNQVRNEICGTTSDPPPSQSTSTSLLNTFGTPLTVTQGPNECVKYFDMDFNLRPPSNILIEVTIDSADFNNDYVRPIFLTNNDTVPSLYYESASSIGINGIFDQSGFGGRKAYQYFSFSKDETLERKKVYFAMYKFFFPGDYQPVSYTYTIKATASSTKYLCPNSCNSQGSCNDELQGCACLAGFFDDDCSSQAYLVSPALKKFPAVDPQTWKYFYVSLNSVQSDMTLNFKLSDTGVLFVYSLNTQYDFYLPNEFFNDDFFYQNTQETQALSFSQNYLNRASSGNLIVGIYNQNSAPIEISASLEYTEFSTTNPMRIYVIIGTVILAVSVVVSVLTACHRRSRANRQRLILAQLHGQRGNQQQQGQQPGAPRQGRQNAFLTKKELQKYFPAKQFSELQSTFAQTTCSICLDEFQGTIVCHQLYCEHIFHEVCIQEWLEKHDSCPNCKVEITKKAIKEHLRAKAKAKVTKEAKKQEAPEQAEISVFSADAGVEMQVSVHDNDPSAQNSAQRSRPSQRSVHNQLDQEVYQSEESRRLETDSMVDAGDLNERNEEARVH